MKREANGSCSGARAVGGAADNPQDPQHAGGVQAGDRAEALSGTHNDIKQAHAIACTRRNRVLGAGVQTPTSSNHK
jgi:hypothetical protein